MATVTAALHRHAAARPDALAVVDGGRRLTWAQLRAAVLAQREELVAQGLGPGERVALQAPDGAAALVAALAVLDAGGVHAPIDAALADAEVAAAVTAVGACWHLRLTAGDDAARLASTGLAAVPDPLAAEGGSAFVRCSSGTTGAAKGVLLGHRTILARVAAANRGLGLGPDDRVLWMLPMAYHFAVSILLYLQQGTALIFGNSLRATTTAAIARAESATLAYLSPYHVRRLAALPAGQDLPPSLRAVVATTTALDAGAAADFHARHGLWVRQGLGVIEVGLPLLSPGGPHEAPGEFGAPLPDYRIAILDERGVPCPSGTSGELAIAGPGLVDAYLSPWRARGDILVDGFFRTGDLASVDGAGRVRLLGRCKDLINVGGVKVFPIEVESVLDAHPAVAASRVRPGPDARTGEQVRAEVQLYPGHDRDQVLAELVAWCAERLAPMKRPAQLQAVDQLPMTGSGKVRRS